MKQKKKRGQQPGARELKKKKCPVKAIFGMAAMMDVDDTFIAPKAFQLFDCILKQSKACFNVCDI